MEYVIVVKFNGETTVYGTFRSYGQANDYRNRAALIGTVQIVPLTKIIN